MTNTRGEARLRKTMPSVLDTLSSECKVSVGELHSSFFSFVINIDMFLSAMNDIIKRESM